MVWAEALTFSVERRAPARLFRAATISVDVEALGRAGARRSTLRRRWLSREAVRPEAYRPSLRFCLRLPASARLVA